MKQPTCTVLVTALVCAAGCVTDELPEEYGDVEQAIEDGTNAIGWQYDRAALLTTNGETFTGYCTGTVIGPRHVLTASRCRPAVGHRVLFHTSSAPPNEASWRSIAAVILPSGVNPANEDYTDSADKFADMVIVRLSSDVPAASWIAPMAWRYPAGGNDSGYKVGGGDHNNNSPTGTLHQIIDETYSDHDRDGHFLTDNQQTTYGDTGGPFHYQARVLGVLHGSVWEWANRDKYASVPHRLPWILQNIGYQWSGDASVSFRRLSGTTLESFSTSSSHVCQYACDRSSSCVAYSYRWYSTCTLLSSVTGSLATSYDASAYK